MAVDSTSTAPVSGAVGNIKIAPVGTDELTQRIFDAGTDLAQRFQAFAPEAPTETIYSTTRASRSETGRIEVAETGQRQSFG